MNSKVGTFPTGTGTADIVVETGFQPKVVIFWWSGTTSATDAMVQNTYRRGVGWAISPTDRACIGTRHDNGLLTTDGGRLQRSNCCIVTCNTSGAVTGEADLKSMDATGFTLDVPDNFPLNLRVSYLALGGADLINATSGWLDEAVDSASTTAVTGLGFVPTLLMIAGTMNGSGAAPSQGSAESRIILGAADGSGAAANWVVAVRDEDNETTADSKTYLGQTYLHFLAGGGASNKAPAKLNSFDSGGGGGFTIGWPESSNSDQSFVWLAIRSTNVKVGNLLTRTDGNDIVVTDPGFKPAAVFFASGTHAANTIDVDDATRDGVVSIGAATSSTERVAQLALSRDNVGTSVTVRAIEYDEVYIAENGSVGIDGLMDLKSIDTSGFTCVMDDAEAAAAFVGYIAFGPADVAGGLSIPIAAYHYNHHLGSMQ